MLMMMMAMASRINVTSTPVANPHRMDSTGSWYAVLPGGTWDTCRCGGQDFGGILASVTSIQENNFVSGNFGFDGAAWITSISEQWTWRVGGRLFPGFDQIETMVFGMIKALDLSLPLLRSVVDCNDNAFIVENNDCNGNQIPDDCEPDCDQDLIDECELDNDQDGIPDDCDADDDNDGIPDECDADTSSSILVDSFADFGIKDLA